MDEHPTTHQITQLLEEANRGSREASDRVVEIVYGELHRLASRYLRNEPPGHILQTTALVHEAYIRLFGSDGAPLELNNRTHFFAVVATQMRRILVDHARNNKAKKRGGVKVPLDEACVVSAAPPEDLVAIDEALSDLEAIDPDASKVVELRYFGGYTDQETAEIMGQNYAKIRRHWEFARAWLADKLNEEQE
jgi:RNA polymerase sigma-70 factor, ECF subfamily